MAHYSKDVIDYEIISFLGSTTKNPKKISLSDLGDFEGSIKYHDLEGNLLKIEYYIGGSLLKSDFEEWDGDNNQLKAPVNGGGDFMIVILSTTVMDFYKVAYNTGTGSMFIWNIGSKPGATRVEIIYVSNAPSSPEVRYHEHSDGVAHGGSGGTSSLYNPTAFHEDDILIKESFENSKIECIYKKLNEMSDTFNNYIQKFDEGAEPIVAHLELSVVDDIPNNDPNMITAAQTLFPENYIIPIEFNQQYLNESFSDMTFARTFAHEILHAEIYRKLLSLAQTPNLTTITPELVESMRNNFEGLYDYYTRFFYDEWAQANYDNEIDQLKLEYFIQIGNDWQHELMGAHYVDVIADMLYDFANGQYTLEQCQAFALGSLKGTIAWNSVKNKDEIEEIISNIMDNGIKTCN